MRYAKLSVVFAIAVVSCIGGCSEDEDTTTDKKYSPEVKEIRKKIYRSGTIVQGLEKYRMATGVYPTTKQGLGALVERPDGMAHPEYWKGPYLENEEDLIDVWGNEFKYTSPGNTHENKYDIISFGPDGEEGTDDDILSWDVR